MKYLSLAIIYLLLGQLAFGQEPSPQYIFHKANSLYEQQRYLDAAGEYNRLIDMGLEAGNIYYNLGNCYFRLGKLGYAILNYERARRFMPRDGDLRANYEYARSLVKQSSGVGQRHWLSRLTDILFGGLTLDGLAIFLSVVYILSLLLFAARLCLAAKRGQILALLIFLCLLFFLGLFSFVRRASYDNRRAIIVAEEAAAGFEPRDNSTRHFTVYEGAAVDIVGERAGWAKISRGDGKVGWVKRMAVEMVVDNLGL
ncbi:MAG: tetratricopeptide repeat protein [Candidatus Omnitrophota bacterium]